MSIMQMITVTNMQIRWFLRNLQLIGLVLKGLATRSLQVGGPYRQTGGKGTQGPRLQQPNLEDPIAAEVRFASFSLNPRVHYCKHVI